MIRQDSDRAKVGSNLGPLTPENQGKRMGGAHPRNIVAESRRRDDQEHSERVGRKHRFAGLRDWRSRGFRPAPRQGVVPCVHERTRRQNRRHPALFPQRGQVSGRAGPRSCLTIAPESASFWRLSKRRVICGTRNPCSREFASTAGSSTMKPTLEAEASVLGGERLGRFIP